MDTNLYSLLSQETYIPDLLEELADESYQPDFITDKFSRHKTKLAWKCSIGHIWLTTLYKREIGSGCLVCAGKQVLPGFNDLESQCPEVAKQWHPVNNGELLPSEVMSKSSTKYWWKCDKEHEWEANLSSRTKNGHGCPVCANQKVLAGFNDLESQYPEVAKRWHPTNNGELLPSNIIAKSNKKYFWLCDKGHSYLAPTLYLIDDRKCGVCANMQTEIGINSLKDTHPELEKEYSHKNKKNFSSYRENSKAKVIWVCNKGHEWESSIHKRTQLGRGCHECKGFTLSKGSNDFLSQSTEQLVKEFDKDKNTVNIDTLFVSSREKVWWKCNEGHEWQAHVYSRQAGSGCPRCAKQISTVEQEISDILKIHISVIQNDRKIIKPHELDIYIPEKRIAIEYNGLYWHSEEAGKDKHYHYNKWLACKDKGIQLIQIWEDDYKNNPQLVKTMLEVKLGVSSQTKVYARNTAIKTLTKQETDDFLNNNHIQGSVDGAIRIALTYEDNPIAVMVLKTEAGSDGKTLNLLRYATSMNVVGGFTKLLSWVEKNIPNITSIVTFSDNTVSDGGLYKNNGFIVAGIVKPDYMYIVKGARVHKFNYRLSRFKTDPNLTWEEGKSESQLAKLNNLSRIWDAGKVKWVKSL